MTERKTVTIGVELPGNSGGLEISRDCSYFAAPAHSLPWSFGADLWKASHRTVKKKEKKKRKENLQYHSLPRIATAICCFTYFGLLKLLNSWWFQFLTSNDDNCRKRCVILWETSVCCVMFTRARASRFQASSFRSREPGTDGTWRAFGHWLDRLTWCACSETQPLISGSVIAPGLRQ